MQHNYGICMACEWAWDMHGICVECAYNIYIYIYIYAICMEYHPQMQDILMEYVWKMHGDNTHGKCMEYVWYIYIYIYTKE